MICPHCNIEVEFYLLSGKDTYCPECFTTIRGELKEKVLLLKEYKPERNYEPDEEWIPDLLEAETERKQKYELTNRKEKVKTVINQFLQMTLI